MASGRRRLQNEIQLTRRSWEDVAPELENFVNRLWDAQADGIPPGFNSVLPEDVAPGDSGSAGLESSGWAAADHAHPVVTGPPAGLANSDTEGSSDGIPRLDHQHKRDVRVLEDAADVGTRNGLNFVNGLVDWVVTDDPGNDRVDVEASGGVGLRRGFGAFLQGSPIASGLVGYARIPYSGTITGWSVVADQVGSIVVDVWKDTWANFPPTVADTITGSEKPTLTSQQKNEDQALTTWDTTVEEGDVVAFYVESVSTVQTVQVLIWVSPS